MPSPPIWSPDGEKILLTLGEDDIAPFSKLEIAIVDIKKNEIALQGEDNYGLGWLDWE